MNKEQASQNPKMIIGVSRGRLQATEQPKPIFLFWLLSCQLPVTRCLVAVYNSVLNVLPSCCIFDARVNTALFMATFTLATKRRDFN